MDKNGGGKSLGKQELFGTPHSKNQSVNFYIYIYIKKTKKPWILLGGVHSLDGCSQIPGGRSLGDPLRFLGFPVTSVGTVDIQYIRPWKRSWCIECWAADPGVVDRIQTSCEKTDPTVKNNRPRIWPSKKNRIRLQINKNSPLNILVILCIT